MLLIHVGHMLIQELGRQVVTDWEELVEVKPVLDSHVLSR